MVTTGPTGPNNWPRPTRHFALPQRHSLSSASIPPKPRSARHLLFHNNIPFFNFDTLSRPPTLFRTFPPTPSLASPTFLLIFKPSFNTRHSCRNQFLLDHLIISLRLLPSMQTSKLDLCPSVYLYTGTSWRYVWQNLLAHERTKGCSRNLLVRAMRDAARDTAPHERSSVV